jgi:hypothetical protein
MLTCCLHTFAKCSYIKPDVLTTYISISVTQFHLTQNSHWNACGLCLFPGARAADQFGVKPAMEFAELILVPKLDGVIMHEPFQKPVDGTLCITGHHLILSTRKKSVEELWVISTCIVCLSFATFVICHLVTIWSICTSVITLRIFLSVTACIMCRLTIFFWVQPRTYFWNYLKVLTVYWNIKLDLFSCIFH